jgi:transposase
MAKRRKFSAEFKARVALEALTGAQTMAELSAKHGVHPNMIAQWKRRVQEGLPDLFSRKVSSTAAVGDHGLRDGAPSVEYGSSTLPANNHISL